MIRVRWHDSSPSSFSIHDYWLCKTITINQIFRVRIRQMRNHQILSRWSIEKEKNTLYMIYHVVTSEAWNRYNVCMYKHIFIKSVQMNWVDFQLAIQCKLVTTCNWCILSHNTFTRYWSTTWQKKADKRAPEPGVKINGPQLHCASMLMVGPAKKKEKRRRIRRKGKQNEGGYHDNRRTWNTVDRKTMNKQIEGIEYGIVCLHW